ncbi:Catalase HPII [compost metagenome]
MLAVDAAMEGSPSIAFDAVWVAGGQTAVQAMSNNGVALHYLLEAYKHLKAMGGHADAKSLFDNLKLKADAGLLLGNDSKVYQAFIQAIARHRVWDRESAAKAIPA